MLVCSTENLWNSQWSTKGAHRSRSEPNRLGQSTARRSRHHQVAVCCGKGEYEANASRINFILTLIPLIPRQETAQLEKEAFELSQRTAIVAEVKSVLDSWVRYESQEREAEQRHLAKSVIDKVMSSLKDDKTQKQILENALVEIEGLVKSKAV